MRGEWHRIRLEVHTHGLEPLADDLADGGVHAKQVGRQREAPDVGPRPSRRGKRAMPDTAPTPRHTMGFCGEFSQCAGGCPHGSGGCAHGSGGCAHGSGGCAHGFGGCSRGSGGCAHGSGGCAHGSADAPMVPADAPMVPADAPMARADAPMVSADAPMVPADAPCIWDDSLHFAAARAEGRGPCRMGCDWLPKR